MALSSYNLPILSIPIYYTIAIVPWGYSLVLANKGDFSTHRNDNPNGAISQADIKRRLSDREHAAYDRARNCHRNCLENMPLFIAAILAGYIAEQEAGANAVGLTAFAVGWLASRVVYVSNFLTAETKMWSFVRSAAYTVGAGWACWVLTRSAWVLGHQ